jgi:hypothetical protein
MLRIDKVFQNPALVHNQYFRQEELTKSIAELRK